MKVFTDSDGHECWALSSDDYVAHAVKNVERELELTDKKLRGKAYRPHDQKYAPETDITPELNPEGIAIYQGYMGIFRVGKILTDYNLADLFTKPLPNDRRFLLLGGMVWMRTKGLREVEKDDARLNKGART